MDYGCNRNVQEHSDISKVPFLESCLVAMETINHILRFGFDVGIPIGLLCK